MFIAARLHSGVSHIMNMTINPVAAIEKLITEHGSAAILKERLLLASDQYAALEKEVVDLRETVIEFREALTQRDSLLAEATAKIQALETRNADLEAHIEQLEKKPGNLKEELPEDTRRVLALLAKSPGRFNVSRLQAESGIEIGKLNFHLDKLQSLGLTHPLQKIPGGHVAEITPEGRACHYEE